jgi:hypothetical protein
MTISEWSHEYWWERPRTSGVSVAAQTPEQRREIGEQFGIPNPDKVAAQVNEICATRLPPPHG